ncbi:ABC transporter ATP-binding protein [Bifidobacterium lemurum]|uniref:ABC transporter ATP-binding protein n=1 Tax=Bifidobacterium lemurum TaxID=1603886 RepID=A0A261FX86_9BIFI|nr:ABC transporter ATP-binding protein [Bifidobacterium lemurum]OZG63366.1 ABC transporter ATP-binding protein [Bifidobacterium lemurum]QOL34275.1 ABC transporter ATP-binding protein [Bifidobacterium lemurum]
MTTTPVPPQVPSHENPAALLQGRALGKQYHRGESANTVLRGVDIDIHAGDFTVIMGASGAGKSTLLYVLSGMDRPTGGEVRYRGARVDDLGERAMARLRAEEFGFVFQQPNLVGNLTLLENVTLAGYVGGGRDAGVVRQESERLLDRMHIAHAAHRLPSQVSGGEAQRAAIARAVINHPGILFADEPTGALNRRNSDDVLDLLSELNQGGQSVLMVTHDVRAAVRANRVLYLRDGELLGEALLGTYRPDESKGRETSLAAWLAEMGW